VYQAFAVTKSDWIALAEILHIIRHGASAGWPPGRADKVASAAHDRKLIYFATLDTIDRISVMLAASIKARCPRFDGERFLRSIGVPLTRS
jgi:hypothetical protein